MAPVCPDAFAHTLPSWMQRAHWYAKLIGRVPDHSPGDAVSVRPATVEPEIAGADVTAGGTAAAWTTSLAASDAPASRLASTTAAALLVVTTKVTGPAPATSVVTSSETQARAPNGPELLVTLPGRGALAYVSLRSLQTLAAGRTPMPARDIVVARKRSVAFANGPARPVTLKRT